MVIGTVTLTRAAVLPVTTSVEKRQEIFQGGGGEVRAYDVGAEDRFITYVLKNVPRTELEALDTFLTGSAGANFRGASFDVTDDWGSTFTARWWDRRLRFVEKVGRLYDVTVTFRKEN